MRSMFSRKFVLLTRGLTTPASLQSRSPRVGVPVANKAVKPMFGIHCMNKTVQPERVTF